jgi:hypothetical protein
VHPYQEKSPNYQTITHGNAAGDFIAYQSKRMSSQLRPRMQSTQADYE